MTTYIVYGYTIGFSCKFVLSNNFFTFHNPNLFPTNPDLTILVNEELLTQLNMPSDRLHEYVVINKKLIIGYNYILAESDSMSVYNARRFFILYPRNIHIGLYSTLSHKHMGIAIY